MSLQKQDAFLVDCHDLDKFVAMHLDAFGVEWRALESSRWDGFHNGSFEEADVAPGKEADWDDGQDFNSWLLGGQYYPEDEMCRGMLPSCEEMLQWLCDLGTIPAGKYVVKLWW